MIINQACVRAFYSSVPFGICPRKLYFANAFLKRDDAASVSSGCVKVDRGCVDMIPFNFNVVLFMCFFSL